MKYVIWISGMVAVVGIAITALLAGASVGDAIVIRNGDVIILNVSQKSQLATALLCAYPTADTSMVQRYYFARDYDATEAVSKNDVMAVGEYEVTKTAAQYLADEVSGDVVRYLGKSGSSAIYDKRAPTTTLSSECKTAHGSFYASTFGRNIDLGIDVDCRRTARGEDEIKCRDNYVATLSPAEYLQAREDKIVIRLLGIVAE